MNRRSGLSSERGATLINAAMIVFLSFGLGTFVVDYGAFWLSRHQAQNAADAGAMAGALARAFDDFDDPPDSAGPAFRNASQVAGLNLPSSVVAAPSFPACPAELTGPDRCVRVDVSLDETNYPELLKPRFGKTLLLTTQSVQATATARVLVANATNCLRPWAVPDKWTEASLPPNPSFRKYNDATGALLGAPHDEYQAPDSADPGTGFRFATGNAPSPAPEAGDFGLALPLTFSTNPSLVTDLIVPGWLVALDLPGGYAACNGQLVQVGDQVALSPANPSTADFTQLFDQDPGATWESASRTIGGSCAPACAPISPRVVAVAVFDTELFQYRRAVMDWTMCPPGRPGCAQCPSSVVPCASIVNIVGAFIDDSVGGSVHLTSYLGVASTDLPRLSRDSSFLKAVTLVR